MTKPRYLTGRGLLRRPRCAEHPMPPAVFHLTIYGVTRDIPAEQVKRDWFEPQMALFDSLPPYAREHFRKTGEAIR